MKVKIIRTVNPFNGSGSFDIYGNDAFIRSVSFNTEMPEGSIWHEEKNRLEAMEIAKKLESVNDVKELNIKETVYETPINTEVIN